MTRYFIIFAGPNGSGKSSLRSSIEKKTPPFLKFMQSLKNVRNINADFFARTDSHVSQMPDSLEKDQEAWKVTEQERARALENGDNIIWETVFSHESRIEEIKKSKSLGYYVIVFYVTTSRPSINIERVANRVKHGGHGVPSDKILSRYKRSTELLPKILLTADEVLVYDNSSAHPVLTFLKVNNSSNGQICFSFNKYRKTEYCLLPRSDIGDNRYNWTIKYLVHPLEEQGCQITYLP